MNSVSLLNQVFERFFVQLNYSSNFRTTSGQTPLELSIEKNLPKVIECLCRKGVDMSLSSDQDSPLWKALTTNEDIASILVR